MDPKHTTRWLWVERTANIGIVLAICFIATWALRPRPAPRRPPDVDVITVGDKVTVPAAGTAEPGRRLLVVFRTGCRFCSASLPFYRALGQTASDGRLAFVSPPGEEGETARMLAAADVGPVPILAADFAVNRFAVTPLILSVDPDRTVRAVWRGRLSSSAEAEVRGALRDIAIDR